MVFRILRFCVLSFVLLISLSTSLAQDTEIAGFWKTEGYGWVLDINASNFMAYQATDATCVLFTESDNIDYQGDSIKISDAQYPEAITLLFGEETFDLEFTLEGANKFLFDGEGVAPIYAYRIDNLPTSCTNGLEESDDPETTFEIFWHMFAENYAFFDLYGVDWQSVYDTYRPQITQDTPLNDVHDIIVEILHAFTDAHVNFLSTFGFHSSAPVPEWTNDNDSDTLLAYVLLIIEDYLIDAPQVVANNNILYGHLSETVGYINILSMYEYSEDGNDIAILEEIMPQILAELGDMESIVIDIRFNGGGNDNNGLYIAGYFTDERYLAFSKQTWMGNNFTDLYDVYVNPVGDQQFLGDVYLMTSGITTSGAEIFTLAMSELPNVTTVGEATAGALSDLLFITFPNGWLATLSNEQYLSQNGTLYERIGIPVDIDVPMRLDAMENNTDPVIDIILQTINNG